METENKVNISKNDYLTLVILLENECTTEMRSFTLKNIADITELSLSKIRKTVKMFKSMEFIKEGAVQHNAKTYYITKKGIEKLNQL